MRDLRMVSHFGVVLHHGIIADLGLKPQFTMSVELGTIPHDGVGADLGKWAHARLVIHCGGVAHFGVVVHQALLGHLGIFPQRAVFVYPGKVGHYGSFHHDRTRADVNSFFDARRFVDPPTFTSIWVDVTGVFLRSFLGEFAAAGKKLLDCHVQEKPSQIHIFVNAN